MTGRGLAAAGAAVGFALLLGYLTLPSISNPPQPLTEAELACRRAVESRSPESRFPFGARRDDADPAVLRGVFDSRGAGEVARWNYECRLGAGAGSVRVDSLLLWQSH